MERYLGEKMNVLYCYRIKVFLNIEKNTFDLYKRSKQIVYLVKECKEDTIDEAE